MQLGALVSMFKGKRLKMKILNMEVEGLWRLKTKLELIPVQGNRFHLHLESCLESMYLMSGHNDAHRNLFQQRSNQFQLLVFDSNSLYSVPSSLYLVPRPSKGYMQRRATL